MLGLMLLTQFWRRAMGEDAGKAMRVCKVVNAVLDAHVNQRGKTHGQV